MYADAEPRRILGKNGCASPTSAQNMKLESLTDLGRMNPAIDPIFHTGCVPGCTVTSCSCTSVVWHYWTSTTNFWSPTTAWLVYFVDGDINAFPKTLLYLVRAVRAGT